MIDENYNRFEIKIHVNTLEKFHRCREICKKEAKQGMKVMNAFVFEQMLDAFLAAKKAK